jgi:hypothetical protein
MAEFTHLHLHTDYSLLDGACDVEKLVDHVADIGQQAVAITDHGNIYGAVHFFEAAKKRGIKPILGCELYICQKDDHRADPSGRRLQPPAGAGGERRGLPEPGSHYVGGFAARFLPEAAHQQEISGGTCQRAWSGFRAAWRASFARS